MQPLVSVILSTYNGNSKWLSESIDSVLAQSCNDFEFIIINDASNNGIEKTILEYQKKDNRIVYIKNNKNLERSKSRNKGINISKGQYIAFLDDDDVWCNRNKLKKQVEFMENNPDHGLCGTGVIFIDESGKEFDRVLNRGCDFEIRKHISGSNQFAHSSLVARKNSLNKSGLFNEDYYLAEDYDLWLRIGRVTKFNNLNEYCLKYRVRIGNTSNKNKFRLNFHAFKIYWQYKDDYPNKLSGIAKHLMNICFPKFIVNKVIKIRNLIN